MTHRAFLALCFGLTVGCGAGATTSTATEPASEAHLTPTPPPRPWAEMSMDERRAHMARHVVPVMGELFARYDEARFSDLGCETCHGPDAAARDFALPNPAILALYPTGSIGQYQMVERYPEGVRFMFTEVVPAMRTMVGAAEYDAATHTGFSCYACHPHAPDDDPLAQPTPSAALEPRTF